MNLCPGWNMDEDICGVEIGSAEYCQSCESEREIEEMEWMRELIQEGGAR